MATNFPGSLDSFTNPTSGSTLDSPSHAGQHANINDAMEAVQAKLGVGAGTIGTWTSYTPSFTNFTLGNGTVEYARYAEVNGLVFVHVDVTLGSTSSVSGDIRVSLPVTAARPNDNPLVTVGVGRAFDSSTSSVYWLTPYIVATTEVRLYVTATTSTYAYRANTSSTVPISWNTGDAFQISFTYEAA